MKAKKAKVYGGWINGTWTQVKAYSKTNAVKRLQMYDTRVRAKDVIVLTPTQTRIK